MFSQTDQASESRKNVFSEIFEFSKSLALWQNQAIRVLFTKRWISPDDFKEIHDIAKKESGIEPGEAAEDELRLKSTELPLPPSSSSTVQLKSLKEVKNVCALEPGQTLSFSERLTVIYGENASGKSSYARVMKRAFRARDDEKIHPNVFLQGTGQPASAVFGFLENGTDLPVSWTNGVPGHDVFGRFAVLDAKCQRVYITKDCELNYLPYGFEIFKLLGTVTDGVKNALSGLAEQEQPSQEILGPFSNDTVCGRFVSGMTAATTKQNLLEATQFTQAVSDLLLSLQKEKADLDSPEVAKKQLEDEKKRLTAARAKVEELFKNSADPFVDGIKKTISNLKVHAEAVNAASKMLEGDKDLEGIGSQAWVTLLKSAANYSKTLAYPGNAYPADVEGVLCVLCQQPLDGTAKDKLKKYWGYLTDVSSQKLDETKMEIERHKQAVALLPAVIPSEVQAWEGAFTHCGIDAFGEVEKFYKGVVARKKTMASNLSSQKWTVEVEPLENPASKLQAGIDALNGKIAAFEDIAAVAAKLQVVTTQIKELETRSKCHDHQEVLVGYLEKLQRSHLIAGVAKKITTRKITEKYDSLFRELVTDGFKNKIREELTGLGFGDIRSGIGDRLEKAKVVFKVTVDGGGQVKPEEIFSEGERTAISIACFLAELELSGDKSGIILDDPISSLDHKVRKKVVERLVAEAMKRQVVIFTHDLVFLSELKETAAKQAVELSEQMVETLDGKFGFVDINGAWDSMEVNKRIGLLEKLIADAKSALDSGDTLKHKALVSYVADKLRSTWERAVEELLFCKVVQRYVREVKTLSLTDVSVDEESLKMVFEGMTRTSNMTFAHDAAAGENRPKATLEVVKKELEGVKNFCTLQRAKNKKAKEDRSNWK